MKKFLSIMLSALMAVSVFTACRKDNSSSTSQRPEEAVTIRLGGLKGPTSMGMVKLLDDAEKGETANEIQFTMATTADELTPLFIKGDLDIIAVPANLGAVLYQKTEGNAQFCAINTLGVLYIVENGDVTVNSIEDLKGKTILATGQGSTPEMALTYLLAQHGLTIGEDVTVEWKSETSEILAEMTNRTGVIAMLPQPYVTVAGTKVENLNVVLDLTKEWQDLDNGSMFITAGLIVNKQFAREHPQALAKFLEEYKASTEYVNSNVEEAAGLVEKYDIVKAAVAQKALPRCNITYIDGEEMHKALEGYLQILFEQKPQSVGGEMPGRDFYYAG